MAIKSFKRNEMKFIIEDSIREILEEEIQRYMHLDKYCDKNGHYMIYNIYYDTENNAVIRKSVEKPYYKEKLRIRSYKETASSDDKVFIELKKKIGGIVNKRRATIKYKDITNFLTKGIIPVRMEYMDKQVLNEIREFLNRYEVKPTVYLSYERVAYVGKYDTALRVTFDNNILTRREKVDFISGDYGTELMENNISLMEIKIADAMPIWLAKLLSDLKVYSSGFSKYGNEYKNYSRGHKLSTDKNISDKVLNIAL